MINVFAKKSDIDIWQGSKYTSVFAFLALKYASQCVLSRVKPVIHNFMNIPDFQFKWYE